MLYMNTLIFKYFERQNLMKKLAIIACSTSGMDYLNEHEGIDILRLTVSFDNQEYTDYTDIKAEAFYQKMLDKPDADIHTSQIPVGVFAEKYETLKKAGYNQILVISLSSKLSGTYQAAYMAKEMVTDVEIEVFDSKYISYVEAYMALQAREMYKKGIDLSTIVAKLGEIRDNVRVYILVDTLKYLVKNGRLSATTGFLGTLLKIKPLLQFSKEGALETLEKIRTISKAQARLVEIILSEIKDKNVMLFIPYTTNKDRAQELANLIKSSKPHTEVLLLPLTPVVGAHAGPGTLGIGYIVL